VDEHSNCFKTVYFLKKHFNFWKEKANKPFYKQRKKKVVKRSGKQKAFPKFRRILFIISENRTFLPHLSNKCGFFILSHEQTRRSTKRKKAILISCLFSVCSWLKTFFYGNLLNMQKVVTAEEMREIDRLTTEKYGIPSILLMENAAHAAARVITEKLGGSVAGKSFLILCGQGNNGGDGAALARILWSLGAEVFVYLYGKVDKTKDDARLNFEILRNVTKSKSYMQLLVPCRS
jgi:hypothetical protein